MLIFVHLLTKPFEHQLLNQTEKTAKSSAFSAKKGEFSSIKNPPEVRRSRTKSAEQNCEKPQI